MKKYYVEDIENLQEIRSFEEFGNELKTDEKGDYIADKETFDWWEALANAYIYIKENEIEIDERYINEFQDYIDIANNK